MTGISFLNGFFWVKHVARLRQGFVRFALAFGSFGDAPFNVTCVYMNDGKGENEDSIEYSHITVNPDCPIRMVYDFIRESLNIPSGVEFDLCDEEGNLAFIYDKDPWERGDSHLKPKSLYFVVLFQREENDKVINPTVNIPPEFTTNSAQINEMKQKIHRQMNPVLSAKASRMSRTRSATVSVKY